MLLNLFEHHHSCDVDCTVCVLALHGVTVLKKHNDGKCLKWYYAIAFLEAVVTMSHLLSACRKQKKQIYLISHILFPHVSAAN